MFRLPFAILPLLATLTPYALASVEFTSPAAGSTVDADSFTITWKDNGDSPKISQLDSYDLQIVLGGNTIGASTMLLSVATGDFSAGNTIKGTISNLAAAGTVKNGWYLQMTSTAASGGGTIINYSDRFTLSGMTGVTPAAFASAVPGGTAGPTEVNNIVNAAATGVTSVAAADADFDVAYNKQSGAIRYAPMQPFPPTKITKKGKPTPQYPTSSYSIATAALGSPSVTLTTTQAQTFIAATMENTAAAAGNPNSGNNDMAKYLARWKD